MANSTVDIGQYRPVPVLEWICEFSRSYARQQNSGGGGRNPKSFSPDSLPSFVAHSQCQYRTLRSESIAMGSTEPMSYRTWRSTVGADLVDEEEVEGRRGCAREHPAHCRHHPAVPAQSYRAQISTAHSHHYRTSQYGLRAGTNSATPTKSVARTLAPHVTRKRVPLGNQYQALWCFVRGQTHPGRLKARSVRPDIIAPTHITSARGARIIRKVSTGGVGAYAKFIGSRCIERCRHRLTRRTWYSPYMTMMVVKRRNALVAYARLVPDIA
eukprot:2553877-Rhodomonas_salina.2